MMGIMNRGGLTVSDLRSLTSGGLGRWMFKQMMKDHHITPLEELRKAAMDMGVKFHPCQMSMEVMEIDAEDLIPGVQGVCGWLPCWKWPTVRNKHYLFRIRRIWI